MRGNPYENVEYLDGRGAFYKAIELNDPAPLYGIPDSEYWLSRWENLMGNDKNRCSECGQTVVPTFKAGDIVDSSLTPGLGVIPHPQINELISAKYGVVPSGYVRFISLKSGHSFTQPHTKVTLVHGYIHIDREKF